MIIRLYMSIVRVSNLRKKYPSFKLDNVSILNLVHPDGGEIEYFGIPLYENEAAIKNALAIQQAVSETLQS